MSLHAIGGVDTLFAKKIAGTHHTNTRMLTYMYL